MSGSLQYKALLDLLHELGVRTLEDRTRDGELGFPVRVDFQDGATIYLDLPEPAILSSLDPENIGLAVIDPLGYTRRTWGLARRLGYFSASSNCFSSDVGNLVESALAGSSGSLYLDGFRYFGAPLSLEGRTEALVLVTNAQEEKLAKRQASESMRTADALRRIGKALTMNYALEPLCLATVHEIASVANLAAVLLWIRGESDKVLRLVGRVGVNRSGTQVMETISATGGGTCVAELVAAGRKGFCLKDVLDHVMTADLEARFCYLKPGGLCVHPLVISDNLLGVLELVGREDDAGFSQNMDLFQTIAEHLALALNSAMLFESFEKLATHDALTGIANHRMMHEFLDHRIVEAQRTGHDVGLVMIDVDHFRCFNEEEGHDAGDEVLKLVADAIRLALRPYDLAARYGGEEFTVVLPGSGPEVTHQVAERIRKRVQGISYTTRSGRERHITISLGCACFPHNGKDHANLLKAADTALFEAKRKGRNRTITYKGAFLEPAGTQVVDVDRVRGWIRLDEQEKADQIAATTREYLPLLAKNLRLSLAQQQILMGLAYAVVSHDEASRDDPTRKAAMDTAEEFRLLIPSLAAYRMRFDEEGPECRIPLLARILAVLMALTFEAGRPLVEQPGRFDPEIVAAVGELEDAA